MTFPCTSCGACCRRVGNIPDFPEPVTKEGHCIHLRGNRCEIYDTRPELCRIKVMIDKEPEALRQGLYELTTKVCNEMQEQDGMEERFRL